MTSPATLKVPEAESISPIFRFTFAVLVGLPIVKPPIVWPASEFHVNRFVLIAPRKESEVECNSTTPLVAIAGVLLVKSSISNCNKTSLELVGTAEPALEPSVTSVPRNV